MGKSLFDDNFKALAVLVGVCVLLALFLVFFPELGAILLLAFVIGVDYILADEFYKIAKVKGYSQRRYFWFSFFFPPMGYLLVIALPANASAGQQYDEVIDALPKL